MSSPKSQDQIIAQLLDSIRREPQAEKLAESGSDMTVNELASRQSRHSSSSHQIANDLLKLIQSQQQQSESGVEFMSEVEQSILRSSHPINVKETEEITVQGQRGLWVNRDEVNKWRGDVHISEYQINSDSNPHVITKSIKQSLEYVQELAIRYLRPPTPPAPGEIIISQEPDYKTGPAPPLIIRQVPARVETPEPLVVREAPPQPPKPLGIKKIAISGKRLPPPPRKVVIERLAPLPAKPQNAIVERWLPYPELKRRVIFNKAPEVKAEVAKPKNVIVQWQTPRVNVRKEVKYLGVIRANPAEYVQRFGPTLKTSSALPQFVLDIHTPSNIGSLAAEYKRQSVPTLTGQLEGFKYVNLDSVGLSEYRTQLLAQGIRDLGALASASSAIANASNAIASAAATSASVLSSAVADAATQVFRVMDTNNNGVISVEEAESIVLKLNSSMRRGYGDREVRDFFRDMEGGNKSEITLNEFLSGFARITKD